ncbi:hypothetical protein LTR99_003941 [Exophiala xenobiotica]|uniref:Uncharacterized protein n=1 Tax=Vermiconidia calcicola TaxID=1690605 RepID=A0AAV9PZ47_9PEZI|nr:hypothetical protein LTR99_003941 [Exophiala xenobiotica]KAK5529740.1 hypothetical protein LTR25_009519 [Vermiconidia calcicola]KAK5549055.1 hypothetical protein LTR23_000885 [Chaetothyriales sp. CCFEE 6169]KAK5435408.1 hypothetical protein LTR34_002912 [Exophiala xenobiotica]KAK5444709.1 hypothetical protein LTR18_004413 [Exophiala xenobiotica]
MAAGSGAIAITVKVTASQTFDFNVCANDTGDFVERMVLRKMTEEGLKLTAMEVVGATSAVEWVSVGDDIASGTVKDRAVMHMFNPDPLYPSWNTLPENQRNSILGRLQKPVPQPEIENPTGKNFEGPIDRYMTRSRSRKLRMSRRRAEGTFVVNKQKPSMDTAQLDEMQVEDCHGERKTETTANTPEPEIARSEDLSAKMDNPEWRRTVIFGEYEKQQKTLGSQFKTRAQRRRDLAREEAKGAGIPRFSVAKYGIRQRITRKKRRVLETQRWNNPGRFTLTDKAKLEAISKELEQW